MSKRAWTYGDAHHMPLHKRALNGRVTDKEQTKKRDDGDDDDYSVETYVGANYMHVDGWSQVIGWLNWSDVKQLVATGDKTNIRRLARAVRLASVTFDDDSAYESDEKPITDTSALWLLHSTPEECVNLRSIQVALHFQSYRPEHIRHIATWNRIASRLRSVIKASLNLDLLVLSSTDKTDFQVTMPPSTTDASVIFNRTLQRSDSKYKLIRECKIVGCVGLKHIDIDETALHNLSDLNKQSLTSLSIHSSSTDIDFFRPFVNLTQLSLYDIARFIPGSFPLSVTRLTLYSYTATVSLYFQGVFKMLEAGNRLTALVIHLSSLRSETRLTIKDHVVALSKAVPIIESYEIIRYVEEYRMFAKLQQGDSLGDIADALNHMPCLTLVPFELFDNDWDTWCTVHSKLTLSSRRRPLQISHGKLREVSVKTMANAPHYFTNCEATGALVRRLKEDDECTRVQSTAPRWSDQLTPPLSRWLETIRFDSSVRFYSTSPVSFLKIMPFLSSISISVVVCLAKDGSHQTNVGEWVKQTLPPTLTSLTLAVSHGAVYDPQPLVDVGITWLPHCLQQIYLINVLPVKRMAGVLPPSITSLQIDGYWGVDENVTVHDIANVQLLDACDWYRTSDGKDWRKWASFRLQFAGVQFDSLLQPFVYQMNGYYEWYKCPANLKRIKHEAEYHPNEDQKFIHTVACF